MTVTRTTTKPGAKCPSCGRNLQRAGHIVETPKGVTDPVCGWCAREIEHHYDKSEDTA